VVGRVGLGGVTIESLLVSGGVVCGSGGCVQRGEVARCCRLLLVVADKGSAGEGSAGEVVGDVTIPSDGDNGILKFVS
jgi:hypothetical protein